MWLVMGTKARDRKLEPSEELLSARSGSAVAETIASTALSIERALSVARVLFLGVILARFYLYTDHFFSKMLITNIFLVPGILFSLYVIFVVKKTPRTQWLFFTSVTIDALACFGALVPNALWPTDDFYGIVRLPDTAGIFVAACAAGFRLSPKVAAWGGVMNLASFLILVGVDRTVSGARFETGWETISLYMNFVLAFGVLAVVLAVTTHRLVHRGALVAIRANRAEQGLGSVLADHHDLRSMLSSVLLNVDLMSKELTKIENADDENGEVTNGEYKALRKVSNNLTNELDQVRQIVENVKNRAVCDLTALSEMADVDVKSVVTRVIETVKTRYDDVTLKLETIAPDTLVRVAGGESTLFRILLNVLDNACEGNESGGASLVTLGVSRDDHAGLIKVHVEDDGPGFPDSMLRGSGRQGSRKTQGLGVGLSVVRGLLEASGGGVRFENRETGGASVIMALHAADHA